MVLDVTGNIERGMRILTQKGVFEPNINIMRNASIILVWLVSFLETTTYLGRRCAFSPAYMSHSFSISCN